MTARSFGLARDCRASVAVEFAMVLPLLVLLVVGSMELGVALMADASLEMGIRAASRFGITVNPTGVTRKDAIRATVLKYVHPWLRQDSDLVVTEKVYASYAKVGQDEPYTDTNGNGQWDQGEPFQDLNNNGHWDGGASSDGGSGAIVVYEARFSRTGGFTGIFTWIGIPALTFDRRTLVQNE